MTSPQSTASNENSNTASWRTLVDRLGIRVRDQPWSDPMVLALFFGLLTVMAYAYSRRSVTDLAVAVMASGAALVVGALTGFLFGIPRAVQDPEASAHAAAGAFGDYRVNTNLEHISDWLTKIIVGLGLTQIGRIPERLMQLAEYTASGFSPPAVPASFVASGLVYFSVTGFLLGYLWTRLLLTGEFSRADREARQSPEFTEGLVQALLYQPSPQGFSSAIRNAEAYNKTLGEGNWRIWRSLACAYGQQYAYLKRAGKSSAAELQAVRDKALDAVKRAIDLNPAECASLRGLWDPKQATPQEDDLVIFADDPGFIEVFATCGDRVIPL